jgi:hypothetical protein
MHSASLRTMLLGFTALGAMQSASADVTITQQTAFDFGSVVHTHGGNTSVYTDDKKRNDTDTHCEGLMSIVCGNLQGGDIVRMDRGITWVLDPKHKRYREEPFTTPEQIAAIKAQLNERMEKLKSCPTSQKQEPVDKSKCKMSPPKFDVRKTGEKATIAGFNAERTIASITESCTDQDTGDVCDTVVAFDAWLTQDTIPGLKERQAFELAYAKKIGADQLMQGLFSGQMAGYMARYQTQLQELSEKAKQFKGEPMKTTFRILSGGPHCSAAKPDSGASAANSSSSSDITNANQAVSKLVGSLFNRKKQDTSQSATDTSAASATATSLGKDFPQMNQLISYSVETTAIKTDAVPAGTFEIPADWTKEPVREAKNSKDEVSCPKT